MASSVCRKQGRTGKLADFPKTDRVRQYLEKEQMTARHSACGVMQILWVLENWMVSPLHGFPMRGVHFVSGSAKCWKTTKAEKKLGMKNESSKLGHFSESYGHNLFFTVFEVLQRMPRLFFSL